MNTMQQGLIALMKSAITQQPYPLPEGFDIAAASDQITRHHIAAMAYAGAALCGISKQDPTMQKLFAAYYRQLLKSEGQMRDVQTVMAAFDAQGIDYMPLKGCKMKALYPQPELRVMGDADILIRMEQYDKIRPVMESLGFREDQESDHELVWKTDRLYLELHKRLIPSYNKDFYAYFGEGWQLARIEQGTRYGMTAEDEMIFLFTHFAKHFRDGGIGCRYVADLWVYRNAHPTMDEEYIHTVLDKIQLSVFYDNILRLIDVWFCDTQTDAKTDFMTDFIFASGSWGTLESRAIANAVKFSRHHSSLGLRGKIKYVLHTLFPSVRQIEGKYTVLKKYPWLLPAVWLWRLGHKILFERKSFVRHQRMLAAFDPDDIQTRQQALNYVGLDYNF